MDWLSMVESKVKELAEGTDRVKASAFFQEYLQAAAMFWQYSWHNQMLIRMQCEKASKVAGFRKWKTLGRKVRSGEKSIRILAPAIKKVKKEEEEEIITSFLAVCVFDISQTEGKPLPEPEVEVKGDDRQDLLDKLMGFCNERNIAVEFKTFRPGYYGASTGGKIFIDDSQPINGKISILLHEIAHELLHKDAKDLTRQQREIQAEGTAFVVSQALGLESKAFNYLALYDADYKKIMENMKAISEASREILSFISTTQNHPEFCVMRLGLQPGKKSTLGSFDIRTES
ncbi:MAG: ArdC-like ssDNA-binding domain-containing protein [Candidatus Micrarchaeota archaeon]